MNSNDLSQAADGAIDAAQKIAHALSPIAMKGWDVACDVTRISSAGWLLAGLVYAGLGALLFYGSAWCLEEFKQAALKRKEKNQYDDELSVPEFISILGCAFFSLGGVVLGINACGALFDIWNWVGMFNPQLHIAHDLTVKAMGS